MTQASYPDSQSARGRGRQTVPDALPTTTAPQHDTLGTPPFGGLGRCNRGARWTSNIEMASQRIRLDPPTTEAIARRVVELLDKRGLQRRELVDAAELGRQFGIERSWVYSHAIELGAVKLGSGSKPRLRFDPEVAARVLRRVGDVPAADPPAPSGKRAGQPRGSEERVELLPIRGQGDSGSAA